MGLDAMGNAVRKLPAWPLARPKAIPRVFTLSYERPYTHHMAQPLQVRDATLAFAGQSPDRVDQWTTMGRETTPSSTPPRFLYGGQVVAGIGAKLNAKEAKRARRTEIEKRSRQRRQGTVSVMREELAKLERQFRLLSSQKDNDLYGAIILPSEVATLKERYLALSREATELREESKQLMTVLHEKQLFTDAMRSMLLEYASDDSRTPWDSMYQSLYEPMDIDECFRQMRDVYDTIERFESRDDFLTSGASVLGWNDKRRLEPDQGVMYFSFSKRFPDQESTRLMYESWDMFCNEVAMRKTIFPTGVDVTLETLQVLSDDIVVMRRRTHYTALQRSFQTVYLLFRVLTDTGYMIGFRTIPSPGIQSALEENESWIEVFHWIQVTRVQDNSEDPVQVQVSFGGSIGGSVIKFALHWMIELIMTVVRWENECIAPIFLTSD
ncbi:hypothetical protein Poli38472_014188 [Pythium oligandrum]|uniref:Uncharacterized protein n=1 Tax=Pythium oligandrum TaxID=41045 RepID=A0A8K1CI84_PYTOL|nr:hypothetical protein Poli38472_014188 [Pythium oligandrum]|eukprot:TMW64071.1 hypothetical protein Poli38472_014188 [Pythium oligandrum]